MSASVIFIHSLFRSSSTYLFNLFRRAERGYWCYQEPLHEAVLSANENPQKLLLDQGGGLVEELRHPDLQVNYFQELVDVWPAWKDKLTDEAVYDGYFAPPDNDIGVPYLQSLVRAARGRPVIQECRTAGRIAAIKAAMGGFHLYLWRNPWDQWWSYKVTRYFDVTNLLVIHAQNAPKPVKLLRDFLHIEDWTFNSVAEGFAHYWNDTATAEQSYLVFYLLWCLGMYEGMMHADLMLNIDRLSDSVEYQSEIQARLEEAGILGIDFSDCRVPQGWYFEKEQVFFRAMERRVHQWLIDGGWSEQDIDQIQSLRQLCQPATWHSPIEYLAPTGLAEQASRARELVKRYETTQADCVRSAAGKLNEVESRAAQAEAKVAQAEAQAKQAEVQAAKAEAHAKQAEAQAAQAEAQAAQAEARAKQAVARAKQALARANQAEVQAAQAEAQAKQAEAQAKQAEVQAAQAEAQAKQAEVQAAQAEAQAKQAEAAFAEATTQLDAVYASASWRITAPFRAILRILLGGLIPVLRYTRRLSSTLARIPGAVEVFHMAKDPLGHCIRYVSRRPSLKSKLSSFIRHFPALEAWLGGRYAEQLRADFSSTWFGKVGVSSGACPSNAVFTFETNSQHYKRDVVEILELIRAEVSLAHGDQYDGIP